MFCLPQCRYSFHDEYDEFDLTLKTSADLRYHWKVKTAMKSWVSPAIHLEQRSRTMRSNILNVSKLKDFVFLIWPANS